MAKNVTDEQRNALRMSSKTLGIMGKFNPEKPSTFLFSNRQQAAGGAGVSAEAFFSGVEPVLCMRFDETAKIGPNVYNTYKITTPLEAGATSQYQIITSDSPLLSSDAEVFNEAKVKLMQKHGGRLVKELVENLDKLAYFTQANFSRSLLKIARDYMYHGVLDELGSFSQRGWFTVLESNYSLAAEIVKYLTAYERDEPEILAAVRAHLMNDTSGEELTRAEQQALEDALRRCKHVMKGGLVGDATWEACAKFQSNADWLENYAGHEKGGLPPLSFVGGRDFLKYYQTFLTTSEATHRLVRSQALHPYIFMWVSSKYAEWDEGEFNVASDVMYTIGVEGQGDKRIPGETFAERSDMFQRVREAEIDDAYAQHLKDDVVFQETFLAIAEDHTYNALLAEKKVTAASVRYRAKKLFSRLSQIAGGTVGELLHELDAFNALFVPFYRIIKNTQKDATEGYRLKDFEERLIGAIGERAKEQYPEIRSFLEGVIAGAERAWEQQDEASTDLMAVVVREFVSAYAAVSKNHFARHYLENQASIQAEIDESEELYDIVRNKQQVSAQAELVGSPVVVTVETTLPDARRKNVERFRQAIYERQQTSNQSQSESPILKRGGKPESLEGVRGTFPVVAFDGAEIAKATFHEDNTVEYEIGPDQTERLLGDDSVRLVVESEGAERVEVLLADTDFPLDDIREIVETQKRGAEDVRKLLEGNAKLAEKQDTIVAEYRKDDADKALSKGLRALLLCEYVLSVPERQSQLGKPDISSVLGLMVDVVEHLVEPGDAKAIDELMVRDGVPSPELSRINLSKYYPVADADELWDIVNYQYQLARELTNVQGYLQELGEIRSFMQTMADTSVDVVVVNATLDEQADAHPSQIVFNRAEGPPSVVYLTSQAKVNQASLQNLATTFAKYAGRNIMANFQMPIFVSPEALPEAVTSGAAVPLYGANELKLNFNLYQASEAGSELVIPDEGIIVDRFVQRSPHLLLATSLLLGDGAQSFGLIRQIARATFDGIRDGLQLEPRQNQPLADLLRAVWFRSTTPLLDVLVFCRWLNQLLPTMQGDDGFDLLDKNLAVHLGEVDSRSATAEFGLQRDMPVLVESERGSFNRPENLKHSGADLTLRARYGTTLRGQQPEALRVPFKDNLYAVLQSLNGGTGQSTGAAATGAEEA